VNLGLPGRNYGWSQREGTFVTDEDDPLVLYQLPPNEVRDFTYPVAQYDHDEGRSIVGGFVYRGDAMPELQGKYVFGDIVNGRIFYTDVDELELGQQAEIQELRLTVGGQEAGFLQLLNATSGAQRADLRFGQGEDGEIYILSKQDGSIRTLQSADGGPAQTASFHDALTLDDVLGGGGEAGAGAPVAAATAASLPPVGGYDGGPMDDLLGPPAAAAGV
jgi:hypothetical protein